MKRNIHIHTHTHTYMLLICGSNQANSSEDSKWAIVLMSWTNRSFRAPGRLFSGAEDGHCLVVDDARLRNIDRRIVLRIIAEVVRETVAIRWDDVAGLDNVKQLIKEVAVNYMVNPALYGELLSPAKILLLFGPPGVGKALVGKCIAYESRATFFSVSAWWLMSAWYDEGERMAVGLFAVARVMQPSVVFIDDIDLLLQHDSVGGMRAALLNQFDGVSAADDDRVIVVGATSRPQVLDGTGRRRFAKCVYIPLPDVAARRQIIENLVKTERNSLTSCCLDYVARQTVGFSGDDLLRLCRRAAMVAVRFAVRSGKKEVSELTKEDLSPLSKTNFVVALNGVRASVRGLDVSIYEMWNRKYGVFCNTA